MPTNVSPDSGEMIDATPVKSKPRKKRNVSDVLSPLMLGLFAFAILLTGVISAVFGHKFGYQRGYQVAQSTASVDEFDGLTAEEVKSLNLKVEVLDTELNTAKQERDISLNNLATLRQSMQDLEVTNLQLQQINDVYGEMLSKQGGIPLQVVGAKIEPLPENAFEYRFDVAMLAKDGEPYRLTPKLTLLDETSLVEVPLDPKSYTAKGIARIRGRFMMPEGFEPKQVKLNLSAGGQRVEKLYNWKLSKPVADMPISLAEIPETDQRPVTEDEE